MVEEDRQCPTEPYHLCLECYRRLHARSLRPREWYNLAAIHGVWTYYLQDDFYDEDGVALQPEEEVIDGWEHPVPELRESCGTPGDLLNYCITRRLLMPNSPPVHEWRRVGADEMLACLVDRIARTANPHVISIALQLCAFVLREKASAVVVELWRRCDGNASLSDLALASACCLDRNDGLGRVVRAVQEVPPSKRYQVIHNLAPFQSAWVLNWIEYAIVPPITDAWGAWRFNRRWIGTESACGSTAADR